MRDPSRRERILGLIRYIWMRDENVDMRLLQLIGNATLYRGDGYHYSDARLEADLREYADMISDRIAQ